jgi:hypothetical protein
MFYGCSSLTTAPELPATTLANNCYQNMFYGTNVLPDCSNIDFTSETVVQSGGLQGLFAGTKVTDEDLKDILPINPETNHYYLPVMNLARDCYQSMFSGCSSLTTAPELPATTLANSCYREMFYGCSSLTTAPELPATTLAKECYYQMFSHCRKLNYIKANFIEYSNGNGEFTNWVIDVSNTGTFVMNPNATYKPDEIRGTSAIPTNWTVVTNE